MSIDNLFTASKPIAPVRAVHLDLKGLPPTAGRLCSLLKVIAAARYNAVLVEWEDTFPWTNAAYRCETAYTAEELDAFYLAAATLGIDIIPLVQCLGHMETPLSLAANERLREAPTRCDVLNPLAVGARELVEQMVDDVLARSPKLRHFHLGGDEAWSFGTHPDTKAYIAKHGKGALYLHHVGPILDKLNACGVRPILWHDMMRDWDSDALRSLGGRADLCMWGYGGNPMIMAHHLNEAMFDRFRDHGIRMWGAGAYKGADGFDVDLPNPVTRQENALHWAAVAKRYDLTGLIATAWSRYCTHVTQNEPIDAALDSLVNLGVIFHDGQLPAGGIEACAAALESIGESARFLAAKAGLQKLTDARNQGWRKVRDLHEIVTMAAQDARRRNGGQMTGWLSQLRSVVASALAAGKDVRDSLAGCIETIWLDRYLAERIEPLRQQLAALEAQARLLDPAGYAAMG